MNLYAPNLRSIGFCFGHSRIFALAKEGNHEEIEKCICEPHVHSHWFVSLFLISHYFPPAAGCPVNLRDGRGNTAAHIATKHGNLVRFQPGYCLIPTPTDPVEASLLVMI